MTQHSFKSLMRDGVFKRVDGFRVKYADLHIEPGFNLRDEGPELDAHRAAMLAHLLAGGEFPPIEVRVSDDGKATIVDGHNRHWVYGEAIKQGAPIEYIDVMPFRGNDVDRVARIITRQEGKKLTPLELARGYKRLQAFKLDADAIAKRFSKTRQHVEQLLILANANADVHELVAAGKVSAALAIDMVRKHGEKAGEVLRQQLDKAAKAGKAKVTPGTVNGKPLPKKIVQGLVEEVDGFMEALPKDARHKLAALENAEAAGQLPEGQSVSVPASALLALLRTHAEVQEARAKQDAKARAKAEKAAQGTLNVGEAAA